MSKNAKNNATTLELDTTNTEEGTTMATKTYAEQIEALELQIGEKHKELVKLENDKKRLIILQKVESGDTAFLDRLLMEESKPKKVTSSKSSVKLTESQVLEFMDEVLPIGASDIAKKVGEKLGKTIEVKDVSVVLKGLVEGARIKSEGKARGVKYTLA